MAVDNKSFDWDATAFFRGLTEANKLARSRGFRFCRVSSLQGFEEALAAAQGRRPVVAVSDCSDGVTTLDTSPHTRRVHTVFIAMPHALGDMEARARCFVVMHELFRQFMTALIRQKTILEQEGAFLDTRIQFSEIDRYFYNGAACAFFQVAVERYTDLRYTPGDWAEQV